MRAYDEIVTGLVLLRPYASHIEWGEKDLRVSLSREFGSTVPDACTLLLRQYGWSYSEAVYGCWIYD